MNQANGPKKPTKADLEFIAGARRALQRSGRKLRAKANAPAFLWPFGRKTRRGAEKHLVCRRNLRVFGCVKFTQF
jgi:hypothetical protein